MSAKNANLVLVERTNQGDGGTAGSGTVTVGLSDGLGSLISTGQNDGNSGGTQALGKVESGGTIQAQAYGTLAVGRASNGAIITTEKDGTLSFGRADGQDATSHSPSQISANGEGAVAFGKAQSGGVIGSVADASTAFGEATLSGEIETQAPGALAHGNAISGQIIASGLGAHAHGSITTAGSQVRATGEASKAFGQAGNGFNVEATNIGAMAFGVAENASISATGQSSLAGGFPLAGPVLAAGVASIAYGDAVETDARLGTTLGLGNKNQSYSSLMIGQYGDTTGATPGSSVPTDPAFLIGNGADSAHLANGYRVDKDGRVTETASKKNTAIRLVSGTVSVNARTDRTVIFDTSSVPGVANLPAGEDGLEVFILDGKSHANTKNISIFSAGSDTFPNGLFTEVINTDGGVRHLQFLGGVWYILGYR